MRVGLKIRHKQGTRSLDLPDGKQAKEIIVAVGQRVPLSEQPEKEISKRELTIQQKLFLGCLTILYAAAMAYGLEKSCGIKTYFPIYSLLLMFLGLGTLGCVIWYGPKFYKNPQLIGSAIAFNMVGLMLLVLILVLWELHRYA